MVELDQPHVVFYNFETEVTKTLTESNEPRQNILVLIKKKACICFA